LTARGYLLTIKELKMDNTEEQLTEENLRKKLGKTLIEWIRKVYGNNKGSQSKSVTNNDFLESHYFALSDE
jgi:hypothetical protein